MTNEVEFFGKKLTDIASTWKTTQRKGLAGGWDAFLGKDKANAKF